MKKISLVVFPALTIVLEALPMGAVCTFAISPTERVRETFSYFSLIPFGYANFAPLITAILTVVVLLLSLISLKKDSVFNALFVLSIITAIISLMPLMYILSFRKKQFRLSPRISPISEGTISDFMTGLYALSFLWSFLENLFSNHKII
mgnify:CR=1 FL=1